MHLIKFVKTHTGKYVMSIILGIGLATVFRSICKGKDCIVYKAPPLDEIQDKIYKFNGKCYNFERMSGDCNTKKQIVEFA